MQQFPQQKQSCRVPRALLETASFYGGFGQQFEDKVAELQEEYFPFEVETEATYFNTTYKRVQLGDPLKITIHFQAKIIGFGITLPVDLKVIRSGASEKYWK